MPIKITMPRLSDTMEEGTLVKWRVSVGDKVSSGNQLADVETDKATMEVQSFDDGEVAKLLVNEGDTLPVGSLIAILAEDGESIEQAAEQAGSDAVPEAVLATAVPPATATAAAIPTAAGSADGGRIRASPVARKIAEEQGVDLNTITGSGPKGRIIKRDVLTASGQTAAPSPATPAAVEPVAPPSAATMESRSIAHSNMRKTIARRLVQSKTTIPHFTVTTTVQMDHLLNLRATLNQQLKAQDIRLSVNDFLLRAVALALGEHPALNASWTDEAIEYHDAVNIGVAVSLPADSGGGLVVPTLHDAQNKSLRQISSETKALAAKARGPGLTTQEMSGGTFTISNLGMLGVQHFEAIINPPQAAILAVGAALEKPVVQDGKIVIGLEMSCTLSCDHRVVDGAMAAGFLQTLKQMLENPAALLV